MSPAEERIVVVPARRASTRLPGKLLLAETGRPLLAHTLEHCLEARAPSRVVAAVDGPELAQVAEAAGAEAVLTDPALPTGSDRAWAILEKLPPGTQAVDVQADEPEIDPSSIDALFGALAEGSRVVTLSAPFPSGMDPEDPSGVKVVAASDGRALFFSRSRIPYPRGPGCPPRLHLGVYGYTREALARFAASPRSPLELAEGLEQLRFLEIGEEIRVLAWPRAPCGINTRADYDAFLERVAQRT
ncbi:MAG: 3-deoxy-manno-octulosonate cytidylyltransferase [Planctomycetota bacterium]